MKFSSIKFHITSNKFNYLNTYIYLKVQIDIIVNNLPIFSSN